MCEQPALDLEWEDPADEIAQAHGLHVETVRLLLEYAKEKE